MMGWIWLSSNVKKYIKEIVDRQARKLYRALKAQIKRQLMDAINIDLRDAIRIEVKRATQENANKIKELEFKLSEACKVIDYLNRPTQCCSPEPDKDLTPHERLDELEKDLGTLITNIAETMRQNTKDIEETSEVLVEAVEVVNGNAEKIEALFDVYQYLAGMQTMPRGRKISKVPIEESEEKSSEPMFRGTFFDGQQVDLSREDVERIMTRQQEEHLSNAPREQVLKMALDSLKSKHGIPSDLRSILVKRGLLGGFSVGTAGHPLGG